MKLLSWVGRALSDALEPSSKRLIALLIALTYMYCDIYNVVKTGQYTVTNKLIDGGMVLILLGLATVPQFIELWKGKSSEAPQPAKNITDEPK